MVRLVCFLKRRPGTSVEEFRRYWREHHGPLVASTRSGSHVLRYEQHARADDDYGRAGRSDYDGVTEQWFASVEDFEASLAEDDYATIAADIPKFLDTDHLVWMLTEEPEVVIDRGRG